MAHGATRMRHHIRNLCTLNRVQTQDDNDTQASLSCLSIRCARGQNHKVVTLLLQYQRERESLVRDYKRDSPGAECPCSATRGQGGRSQAGSKGARTPTTEEVAGAPSAGTQEYLQAENPSASGVCVRATGVSMSDTGKHTPGTKRRTKDRKRTASSKD